MGLGLAQLGAVEIQASPMKGMATSLTLSVIVAGLGVSLLALVRHAPQPYDSYLFGAGLAVVGGGGYAAFTLALRELKRGGEPWQSGLALVIGLVEVATAALLS